MKNNFTLFNILIISIASILLLGGTACGHKNKLTKEMMSPEELFAKGEFYMNRKPFLKVFRGPDYNKAREHFEQILYRYPLSPYAPKAELKIADSYFDQKKYIVAAASYADYKIMHRTSPEYPYVLYRLGMSHYKESRRHDRDQTDTRAALKEFTELASDHPESEYAQQVTKEIYTCKNRLAKSERYVARHYFKQEKYWSAVPRYQMLALMYPEAGLEPEGAYYAAVSYKKLDHPEDAAQWLRFLMDNFPSSKYADKARAIEKNAAWGQEVAYYLVNDPGVRLSNLESMPLRYGPAPVPKGIIPEESKKKRRADSNRKGSVGNTRLKPGAF